MFCSCDLEDNDNQGEDDNWDGVQLTAVFNYQINDSILTSPNTRMYIFDTYHESTNNWIYNYGKHYYEVDGEIIYPRYSFQANSKGIIEEDIAGYTSYIYVFELSTDKSAWGGGSIEAQGRDVFIEKTIKVGY